jgi:hypothetical protein
VGILFAAIRQPPASSGLARAKIQSPVPCKTLVYIAQ